MLPMNRQRQGHRLRRGFTLVELLVVIVIIGLLATAVVTNYDKIFPKGREARVKTDLLAIESAIDLFKMENNGKLPENLGRLVEPDSNGQRYIKDKESVPLDPWDHEYFYNVQPNGTYDLGSYGADGQPGGDGENGDVTLKSIRNTGRK